MDDHHAQLLSEFMKSGLGQLRQNYYSAVDDLARHTERFYFVLNAK